MSSIFPLFPLLSVWDNSLTVHQRWVNEVFVEMKNVIINLITDSNVDLWMARMRQERWKILFEDRKAVCR